MSRKTPSQGIFPSDWPLGVRLLAIMELFRGSRIIMAERLPTGELVFLARDVLERHVQLDRQRDITLEDVVRLIRAPDAIFEDCRKSPTARGRYFAVKLKANPFGTIKVKKLIAHLKRCRKWGFIEVSFVSTVLLAKKLPPQAKLRWKGTIETI